MTAGEAIKMADELRPNNHFENRLKQLWLRQADSGMRRNIVERSQTGGDFEDKGADILWNDGLEYDTPLLACCSAEDLYHQRRSTLSALAGCADGPCTGRDGPGSE